MILCTKIVIFSSKCPTFSVNDFPKMAHFSPSDLWQWDWVFKMLIMNENEQANIFEKHFMNSIEMCKEEKYVISCTR